MPNQNSQTPDAYPDITQESPQKGEPFNGSGKKQVESVKMSGQTISHDSRKGPLAGEDIQIPRNQHRNNEHIKYDETEKTRYTSGG